MPSFLKTTAGGKAISGGALQPRGRRGNTAQIVDYWFGGIAELDDFNSIATITVGVGGSNGSVTFSSIPQTYKHLQIRALARTDRLSTWDGGYMYFNGDTSLTNYTLHELQGNSQTNTASSAGYASATGAGMQLPNIPGNSLTSEMFSGMVVDILDYTNTNKNTVIRDFSGLDYNGGGRVSLSSGAWLNTASVTSITMASINATEFLQYSSFALYGIKG